MSSPATAHSKALRSRRKTATLLLVGVACTCAQAKSPDMRMLTAQAAATVKQLIPGSEAEMQGSTGVVKKGTHIAPDIELHGGIATKTGRRTELPDSYGVLFIIRLHTGPHQGSPLPKAPQFDPHRAQPVKFFLRGCFRTTTVQEYSQSNTNVVVDILFGEYTDTAMLQGAYRALSQFLAAQLGRST
jgi:hypothetical protein